MKKLKDFNLKYSTPTLSAASGALTIVPSANDLKVDLHQLLDNNGIVSDDKKKQITKNKSLFKRTLNSLFVKPKDKITKLCGFVDKHRFSFSIEDVNNDGKTTIELVGKCDSKIIAPGGKCVIDHKYAASSKVYSLKPGEYVMEVQYV